MFGPQNEKRLVSPLFSNYDFRFADLSAAWKRKKKFTIDISCLLHNQRYMLENPFAQSLF